MAEVGGGENEGQTVIVSGSECAFDFYCEVCRDDSKHLEAAGYCVDCEEYLCGTCVNSHKRARPCRFHKILDKYEMPKDTRLTQDRAIKSINTRCEAHPGEPVKFYCNAHRVFGCTNCFATGHRACGGIESIVDKSETVLDCGEFKTFIQNLSSMKQTLSSVIETVQSNIAETKQDCQNAITSVREFRKEINIVLDEVEQRIITKAHSVSTKEIARLENLLRDVRSLSEKVDTISSETEKLRTSRHICQLYIKMKEMDTDIKELLCRVSGIANLKPVKRLSFKPNAELYRFEKDTAFGDLSETEIAARHTKDAGKLIAGQVGRIAITQDDQIPSDFHKHEIGSAASPEDVGNWKEGGGRGAMLQQSSSKDAQSPASSSLDSQTETPQNCPPMSAGGTAGGDTPPALVQQLLNIPLRPSAGPGPGGMPMGPPGLYSSQPGYRGMMPPCTQFRGHYPTISHSIPKHDLDIDRRYRYEPPFQRGIFVTPWSRASQPPPRLKASVQIYCHRRSDKINALNAELERRLQVQCKTINTDLACTSCDQREQLDIYIPIIVLCIYASKLGKAVTSSLEGLSWTNKVVVVVLHENDSHAPPRAPSNQRLTTTGCKSLGGLIDMAFLPNKGIYPCEMNTKALAALMSFIKSGRID